MSAAATFGNVPMVLLVKDTFTPDALSPGLRATMFAVGFPKLVIVKSSTVTPSAPARLVSALIMFTRLESTVPGVGPAMGLV